MQTTHAASTTSPITRGPLHVPSARLVRIQAASGLVFAVFGGLHLVNTALGALGPGAYNGFQRALRPIYQYPLIELSLILVPLVVHAAASIARMRARRSTAGHPPSAKLRAHRLSGWFLLAVMVGHVFATRGPAVLRDALPEFEGVAFTFQFMPGYFYPYYTLLALSGVVHLLIGAPMALARLGVRVPEVLRRGRGSQLVLGAACAAVLLGVAGLGGLLFPVADVASHPFVVVVSESYAELFGTATSGD